MGKKRIPHLCSCGCGKPLKEMYNGAKFKGYSGTYAPNCPNREALLHRPNPQRGHYGMDHPFAVPIGSRRIHHSSKGFVYWIIKTKPIGPWEYEHRVIAEQLIGRPLKRGEHVHHKNEDTLDNWPDNLEVLTQGDHLRGHHQITTWSKKFDACVVCGETKRKHSSRGACTRCHQHRLYHAKVGH